MPKLSASARACACAPFLALALVRPAAAEDGVTRYASDFFAAQRPANAEEMLQRLPGFNLDLGESVRGFEGAAGNVLIDGQRPPTKTDSLQEILQRIPAAKVERIEVIRGGAPGVDMQGKPVVANVVLKRDDVVRGDIAVETQAVEDGRTFAALEGQASGAIGERKWEVSGAYGRSFSGLTGGSPAFSETRYPDGRSATHASLRGEDDGWIDQATAAYEQPLGGGRLRLNAYAYYNHLRFQEDARDLATGALRSNDQLAFEDDRELGARYTRPLWTAATLELVALRKTGNARLTSSLTAADGDQRFDLRQETGETIGRAVVKYAWSPAVTVEGGGETARNRLETRSAFAVAGLDVPLPGGDVAVAEDRAEAFAKASWRAPSRFVLDGALRYERSEVTSDGDVRLEKTLRYLKPRLTAAWSPDAADQLRLRVEREVGQLDFQDFVAQASLNTATGVTAGNVDLEPERAWTLEATFERRFWTRGSVSLTATRSYISDVVDRGPVISDAGDVFDRPANIGDGRKDSLRLDLTLPLERAGVKGGQLKGFVVKRWSRVDDPTTGERRRISGLRHIEWELHFTQDLPAQNLTWGAEAYGGWQVAYYRFNAVDEQKLDPFLMVFGEWRPRPDIIVRAEVGNLADRGYRRVTLTTPGPRGAGLPETLTERETYFGRNYFLRIRKTFGG